MSSRSSIWHQVSHWFRALLRRGKLENELDTELRFDLERRIEANVRAGMAREEARRLAFREFGGIELAKEECRDTRGTQFLEQSWQDIRFGLRMLRKNPGFTVVAVLTLALGIGANTAIFSIVNGVLLNPLPFPSPDQLVTLHMSKPNFEAGAISYPNFLDWQRENNSFSSMALTHGYSYNLTGVGSAEQVTAEFITSAFFPMVGVKPVIGRLFSPSEDAIGVGNVVAISTGLWARKFASSPYVLGKTITLDGKDYTIVGVIPSNFTLPLRNFRAAPDIYAPLGEWTNNGITMRGAAMGLHGIGRLKPGVTIDQARADMQSVTRHLAQVYPEINKGTGATIYPLKEEITGPVRPFLILLLGAVTVVLLIACVNVANLLLARSTGRAREIAVRSALGAGTGRLVRQMLTESVLLALAGGGLGLLLTKFGMNALLAALPAALPRASEIHVDTRVLLFTLAASVCAGIVFGLIPALRMSRANVHETLKEGGRGGSGTRHRAQGTLVAAEMAMALVLLVGAGLLIRSLAALWRVSPGYDPDNVITFSVAMPPSMINGSPDAIRVAARNLEEKIALTPGVEAASLTWAGFPMSGEDDIVFLINGQPKPASQSEMNWCLRYVVGTDYLKAMRIPLVAGRFFTARDDQHSPRTVVVDDVFARKFFPKGDAIGNAINLPNPDDSPDIYQIIGIVGHVKQWGLDTDDSNSLRAQAYFSVRQLWDNGIRLIPTGVGVVVRTNGSIVAPMDSIRRTVHDISGEQSLFGVQSANEIIAASLAARRYSMLLLGAFAILALILACTGIYGVIAYLVGQRTQEIGIRMALGAQQGDILRWVLGSGARISLIGIAAGLVAAAGLTRVLAMSSLLFGVSATDPLTFGGVAVLLFVIALVASWIPARRATRVDPITALRHE